MTDVSRQTISIFVYVKYQEYSTFTNAAMQHYGGEKTRHCSTGGPVETHDHPTCDLRPEKTPAWAGLYRIGKRFQGHCTVQGVELGSSRTSINPET